MFVIFIMKKNIHPPYYEKAKIICSCGAFLETGSTQKNMRVEICSQCHPLYTGKKKIVDTTGRVERFKKITKKTLAKKEARAKAKKKPLQKKTSLKKTTNEKNISKENQ